MRKLSLNGVYSFGVLVGKLERSIVLHCVFVYKCAEYANYQEVEAWHVQFVLRTKEIGRVRRTSSTTQTCVLKSIMVFFEVACTVDALISPGKCL